MVDENVRKHVGMTAIHLSLSHDGEYAIAYVLIEGMYKHISKDAQG